MPKIIKNGVTYAGMPAINYDCEVSEITLYAANWNTTTNIYTISDARIDPTSVQEYLPAVGITDTQLEALQAANIADGGQDTGHAYLKAYGDVPEIDIPIRVMFNPGVKTKEVENDKLDAYSTDETVVGTWIDGKPIYRKVITGTLNSVSETISIGISDVSEIVRSHAILQGNGKARNLPFSYGASSSSSVWYGGYIIEYTNSQITFEIGSSLYGDMKDYKIIIEYTKTTD